MSYLSEFPDYDDELYVPEGWEDNSWHNDLCPHAEKWNAAETVRAMLWQDYKDVNRREYDNTKRYSLQIDVNGTAVFLFDTDDLELIKEMAKGVELR